MAKRGLYIAQTMQMLLNENSYESFRIQSLDCIARLMEIREISKQISTQNISTRNIVDPCNELASTLINDEAAKSIIGKESGEIIGYFAKIDQGSGKNHENIAHTAKFVLGLIGPYYKIRTENDLTLWLNEGENPRSHAYRLIQNYLSTIINSGYSKEYVRDVVQQHFFSKDIVRFSSKKLELFFELFRYVETDFEILLPVHGSTRRLFDLLDLPKASPKEVDDLPDSIRKIIASNDQFSPSDSYIEFRSKGLDPYSVFAEARKLPQILHSVTILQDKAITPKLRRYAFFRKGRSKKYGYLFNRQTQLQQEGDAVTKKYSKMVQRFTRAAIVHFEDQSTQRILSSSENVLGTFKGTSSENQLILIWAAIEVLLGDPPDESSRLDHYRDCLTPCVVHNYPWRYTNAVRAQVTQHHRPTFEKFVEAAGIESSIDDTAKFQELFFDPNNLELRNQFLIEFEDNPAAAAMLRNLQRSFGTADAFFETVKRHTQRVSWQISRVYRCRNQFIHSGTAPSYKDTLAKNAFEYYRTALQSILFRSEKIESLTDIDMLVHSIQNSVSYQRKEIDGARKSERKGNLVDLRPFLRRS